MRYQLSPAICLVLLDVRLRLIASAGVLFFITAMLVVTGPALATGDPEVEITSPTLASFAADEIGSAAGTHHGPNLGARGLVDGAGRAAHYDGVDDYTALPAPVASPALTWEAWVRVDDADKDQMFLTYGNGGNYMRIYNAHPRASIRLDGAQVHIVASSVTVADGDILHLAMTWDGTTARLYVNGAEEANAAASGTLSVTGAPSRLGRWIDTDPRSFEGVIDEVAIYDRALSATELNDRATATSNDALSLEVRSTADLINYWRLEEVPRSGAVNEIGTALDGEYLGDPQRGTTALSAASASSTTFDGAGDGVAIPTNTSINETTWEAWVKPSDASKDQMFLTYGSGASYFRIYNRHPYVSMYLNGTQQALVAGHITIADDQLVHLAVSWDGTTMRLYVDGAEEATKTATGPLSFTSVPSRIGQWVPNDPREFNGTLSDVAVYSRALSATELSDHYAATDYAAEVLDTADLDSYWRLDEPVHQVIQTDDRTVELTWVETSTVGIVDREVQRQRTAYDDGECSGTWSDDGAPLVDSTSPVEDDISLSAYCYRWAITITDSADVAATSITDPVWSEGYAFTTPDPAGELVYYNDFETASDFVGWTFEQRTKADGNHFAYGLASAASPYIPIEAGARYRISLRNYWDGSRSMNAGFCWHDSSNVTISCTTWAKGNAWTGFSLNLVAPASAASLRLAYPSNAAWAELDDLAIVRQHGAEMGWQLENEIGVEWSEPAGVASRSLQRQRVTATSTDSCWGAGWSNDGSAATTAGPISQTGLLQGYCYRWIQEFVESNGERYRLTSAPIAVGSYELETSAAPAATAGANHYLRVKFAEGGTPSDTFAGPITLTSSDPLAVFPAGPQQTLAAGSTEHEFRVLFGTPGQHTVTIWGRGTETVTADPVEVASSELDVSGPTTVYAGVPFVLSVDPRDAQGQRVSTYAGNLSLGSTGGVATFGQGVVGNEFTMSGALFDAQALSAKISALGTQTVSVTDPFGVVHDHVVNVVAAPSMSGVTDPVEDLHAVQWSYGTIVDYYLRMKPSAGSITVIEDVHTCGVWGQPPKPGQPYGFEVEEGTAVSFSAQFVDLPTSCHTSRAEYGTHTITYTDNAGHYWQKTATRHSRFSTIPTNTDFTMLDAGDPVSSLTFISAEGMPAIGQWGASSYPYVPEGLEVDLEVLGVIQTYAIWSERIPVGAGAPLPPNQRLLLGPGLHTLHIDHIPMFCHAGPQALDATGYGFNYSGPSGRIGSKTSVSGLPYYDDDRSVATWCPDHAKPQANPNPFENSEPETNFIFDIIDGFDRFLEGDPVDPLTGSFIHTEDDFALGGLPPFLSLDRTYSSGRAFAAARGDTTDLPDTLFGRGWSSDFDWGVVAERSGGQVVVRTADGGLLRFAPKADGTYLPDGSGYFELAAVTGGWEIVDTRSQTVRLFNSAGLLSSVEPVAGGSLNLVYDTNGALDSVTDAAGRTADVSTAAGLVTRIDLPDGRYLTYSYDSDGDLLTHRAMDGVETSYITDASGLLLEVRDEADNPLLKNAYDAQGRIREQTDAMGEVTYFSFNTEERVTEILDPRGARTTSHYSPAGELLHRVDPEGGVEEWSYDSAGNPVARTDELDRTTRFTYDAAGRPLTTTDALGRTVEIAYDAAGRVTDLVGADGSSVETVFDSAGRPITVTRVEDPSDPNTDELVAGTYTYESVTGMPETVSTPGGAASTFAYDADGYLVGVTDAEGRETTHTVDARGFTTATVGPLGNATGGVPADHTTSFTHDAVGRVLTSTNPENETWTFTYDDFGRTLTETSPLGFTTTHAYDLAGRRTSTTVEIDSTNSATTTFEYDEAGNLTASVDAELRRTEFEYDLLGRRVLTRDADEEEWLIAYDAAGQVVSETDPTGRATTHLYDDAGRRTKTIDPDLNETVFAYNSLDQLTSVTDPLGHATTYTYDWLGRRITQTNHENETTTFVYSDAGDLVTVTDPLNRDTSFEWNDTHQLTKVTDAHLEEASLAYDAAGRLTSRTDPRGKAETYAYDNAGRLLSTTDPRSETWLTSYDDDGRVSSTTDANGQTLAFAYDRAGRLTSITPPTPHAPVAFTYDDTGRRLSMTDANGVTAYDYDANGRLVEADRDGRVVAYAYDAAGRPTQVTYPGTAGSVNYTYDTAGRVETITDWAQRVSTFTHDDAGRLTSLDRPNDVVTAYAYDDANRVTAIDYAIDGTPELALDYVYDDAGNITQITDDLGAATFTYDDLNRVTAASYPGSQAYSYVYDEAGNLTSVTKPGGTETHTYDDANRLTDTGYAYDDNGALLSDGTRAFTYDIFGRLVGVEDPAGGSGTDVTYELDGEGNRVGADINGTAVTYDLDLRGLPTVLDDGTHRYLPGMPSLGWAEGSDWHSALTNHQGSLLADVDPLGAVSTAFRYDAYGAPRPGSSAPSHLGYTGEMTDPTGLLNLRYRAYDPGAGMFFSRDSFSGLETSPSSWNRYAYALGNPIGYTDPSGHFVNLGIAVWNDPGLMASIGVQMLPFVGDAYAMATAIWGYDPLAGLDLSPEERIMAMAGALAVGGGLHLLNHFGDVARAGDGAAGAAGFARSGSGVAGGSYGELSYVTGPGNRTVLSGHGTFSPADGYTTVPDGVTVHLPGRHGDSITDGLGNQIELNLEIDPAVPWETHRAGSRIPNYRLGSPDSPGSLRLNIEEQPGVMTTNGSQLLSDTLSPGMGDVCWAACRVQQGIPNDLWGVEGLVP